ncbi:ankyrin repeat domain-containing protein 50-like [Mya arenaria]|uniref:ankyrin repeat domain-containing protein 50-like n=1 Tax=Mya arenaria TaxID=6604 RepID=UPI0022E77817|nr:ankyrin repeat domain-containing protein 50-like [Mya arenaria]
MSFISDVRTLVQFSAKELRIVTCTKMEYFEDDLYDCLVKNKKSSVLEYLKRGLDPNHAFRSVERPERMGKTMLEIAVLEGVTDIVKLLIDRKCDVNLMYIVNVNQFSYQLEEYRKPERLKMSCIYRCIVHSELHLIKLLVGGGFDVNIHDERGCSALWHAVDLDDYQILKAMLLTKTADVNKNDNTSKLTPLHIAAMKGNVKMTTLLIQRGAEVDRVQLRGSTPLILACRSGNFETVRVLLLNGANPNHTGFNGHNAISTALQSSTDTRIPEILLVFGAVVELELMDIIRKEGKKFLLFKEHPEFYEVLKECAAGPRTLRTLCCMTVRRRLLENRKQVRLVNKVELLPLPRLIKDYVLYGH